MRNFKYKIDNLLLKHLGENYKYGEYKEQSEIHRLSLASFSHEMRALPLKDRISIGAWIGKKFNISSHCRVVMPKRLIPNFDFSGLNLWGSDFSNTNLEGANFIGADLNHCDFSYANLQNCVMTATTSVCWVNFWGADFAGADIKKADFTLADTNNTNIHQALSR